MSFPIPPDAVVCDACGEAACWEGKLYCTQYRRAGTVTRREWEERHCGPKISVVRCPECGAIYGQSHALKCKFDLAEALRRIQADMYERGGEE